MSAQTIEVATQPELDAWIAWLQPQGFGLRWYQPPLAMLVRPKRLSAGWLIFWLLIGWVLIWIPLVVYLILFAVAQDEIVTIRITWPPLATGMASAFHQLAPADHKAVTSSWMVPLKPDGRERNRIKTDSAIKGNDAFLDPAQGAAERSGKPAADRVFQSAIDHPASVPGKGFRTLRVLDGGEEASIGQACWLPDRSPDTAA